MFQNPFVIPTQEGSSDKETFTSTRRSLLRRDDKSVAQLKGTIFLLLGKLHFTALTFYNNLFIRN